MTISLNICFLEAGWEYSFEGLAGQTVSVVMESLVFDPFLMLIASNGEVIGSNGDYKNKTTNAAFVITLPQDGLYSISATGLSDDSQGDYRVMVVPVLSGQDEPVFSSIGQQQLEASQLSQQGIQHLNNRDYSEAIALFKESLAISQSVSDRLLEFYTLSNIGQVYCSQEQYEQALSFYQTSLSISQEIGNRNGEGITLNNIGYIYYYFGQYNQALNVYQQSLSTSQDIGNRRREGITLNNIATVYENLGQYEQALSFYEKKPYY